MICEHKDQHLVRRVVRGGAVQYVYQCMTCGSSRNQPLSHERVRREFSDQQIPDFDDEIEMRYRERRLEEADAERGDKRAAFLREYSAYLKGPEWAEKRRLVMQRCRGTCEGCGKRPAVEVHHLTYDHVFDEFLFELVGMCKPCHERIHPEPPERE